VRRSRRSKVWGRGEWDGVNLQGKRLVFAVKISGMGEEFPRLHSVVISRWG
jgi:hypothetical protein